MANYYHHQQDTPYKTAKELIVEKTIQEIQLGLRVLVLMRGLPGSGKSYLAKEIVKKGVGVVESDQFIFCTDDYFINPRTKQYNFDMTKLGEAHFQNQRRAFKSMENGISPIIIDNTNVTIWQMIPYVKAAVQYGYMIEVVEPFTKWASNTHELAKRNVHRVPLDKLESLQMKYDINVSAVTLFAAIGIFYTPKSLYRQFPPLFNLPQNPSSAALAPKHSIVDLTDDDTYVSGDEQLQENTSPNTGLQAKHTTATASNSSPKKVCTSNISSSSTLTKTPSEIHKARDIYPHLNLASWGLNEKSVTSWNEWGIVNPVTSTKQDYLIKDEFVMFEDQSNVKEKRDAATYTDGPDFWILHRNTPSNVQYKVLSANNRDINKYLNLNQVAGSPPKRTILHKGCMTDDIGETDFDQQISKLSGLFPNIPTEYLIDIFEKCKQDLNWTVDLLLDDEREILPVSERIVDEPKLAVTPDIQEHLNDLKITNETTENTVVKTSDSMENVEELQKHIENIIDFGPNHYSDHVLKVKGQRHPLNDNIDRPTSSNEIILKSGPDDLSVVSDSESDPEPDTPGYENEEVIEINLNENVVSQLEAKLGFEEVLPGGFLPIVHLPVSLARQLYATYVESVLGQIEVQNQVLETIIEQDKAFALKLQQQEITSRKLVTLELPEIMNEQVASNIYQKEVDQWKLETPDNLATRMTLQKLSTAFPQINNLTLKEVYHAHNNSYNETLEVLLASTDNNSISDPEGTLKLPPISENVLVEMKAAHDGLNDCSNIPDLPKSAQEYRDEATLHHIKHNELIQKATQAYQRKQYDVAQFYSDIARKHTNLYDQANNLAASAFLNQHAQALQNFYTIDLHFLYVKEAVAALDIFIDKNIQLLNNRKHMEHLFVITGRGKRSDQGKSKLKPVIMARLRKRKIRYWELNPGLLKIRVLYTSSLTSNI